MHASPAERDQAQRERLVIAEGRLAALSEHTDLAGSQDVLLTVAARLAPPTDTDRLVYQAAAAEFERLAAVDTPGRPYGA
ncbi:hypothetical protein [Streptomyces hokutonensis]|uniref:hypothetical protein n=1 Tax=Streptomyces hokutonensis TaxID=1306990 RepID=UPI000361B878|nr:hypothetical protein [Streptomyces hokutonensis]